LSIKEISERIKKRATEMREDMKGTVRSLEDGLPHPFMNRPTLILREPLVKRLQKRRGKSL